MRIPENTFNPGIMTMSGIIQLLHQISETGRSILLKTGGPDLLPFLQSLNEKKLTVLCRDKPVTAVFRVQQLHTLTPSRLKSHKIFFKTIMFSSRESQGYGF